MNDDYWDRNFAISARIDRLKMDFTEDLRVAESEAMDIKGEVYAEVTRLEEMLAFAMAQSAGRLAVMPGDGANATTLAECNAWWAEYQARTQVTQADADEWWAARQAEDKAKKPRTKKPQGT